MVSGLGFRIWDRVVGRTTPIRGPFRVLRSLLIYLRSPPTLQVGVPEPSTLNRKPYTL